MNGLLPFVIILTSTVLGLTGVPLWSAFACGLALAICALSERSALTGRAVKVGKTGALSLAAGASLVNALVASVGAFAIGRLISGLLV